MAVTIIQTATERHVENVLFGGFHAGDRQSLCGIFFGHEEGLRTISIPRIPGAAVCPDCVAVARRWHADFWFEPFDCVQRERLLKNIGHDLDAVA